MDTHRAGPNVWRPLLDAMVDKLKADGHLHDPRIEQAMRSVPRHEFLQKDDIEDAYTGEVVRTMVDSEGGTVSTASHVIVVARMLEGLDPQPDERVLEVGLGTGYNAALLATLIAPGPLTAIDNEPWLVERAAENLQRVGVANVRAIARDGWFGDAETQPFDAIVATVSLPDISPHWVEQLVHGGRLVAPMFITPTLQPIVSFAKDSLRLVGTAFSAGSFIKLKRQKEDLNRYVVVDDIYWEMCDTSVEKWTILKQLLADPARAMYERPELQRMWPVWLGLEDQNVVMSYSADPEHHGVIGLFDADAPGLAVVDKHANEIRSYGDGRTCERLMDLLARMPDLPTRPIAGGRRMLDIDIDAVPHGSAEPPDGGWLIERPNYDFVVRWGRAVSRPVSPRPS